MSEKNKVIIITGPTATGKTALAIDLAEQFDCEIISVDSRQVYRGLDIGSGKDLDEYCRNGRTIPYHLLDIAEPDHEYNLMEYCRDAEVALAQIIKNSHLPIFCGGTALYLNALLASYTLPGPPPDQAMRSLLRGKPAEELAALLKQQAPDAYEKLKDKGNPTRLLRALEMSTGQSRQVNPIGAAIEPLVIGVYYHRRDVHRRIEERLDSRLASGMIAEVEQLQRNGVSWERLEFLGLEYRYVALHLQGKLSLAEMREKLFIKIRQFAKRQDIWFRKMEREGMKIYWLDEAHRNDAGQLVEMFLGNEKLPPPAFSIKDIHYGPVTS
ncbi:MAG: tRNA (adenosine(37)-N6)-dimethylallyltransferase MiaA [Victivallaceae bacterium]|nr:tRNA (adenosine(37)-N6)-dimethylallyltransferase MiaA [Victivallaceae bacterium]